MLLEVSEWLPKVIDVIKNYWGQLTAVVTIPVIVGFLLRFIFLKISNKKTIKNATLDATKAIQDKLVAFEETVQERLTQIETTMGDKIDAKYNEMKEKRKEAYNNIMNGIDVIETKTVEIAPAVEEFVEKIDAEADKCITEANEALETEEGEQTVKVVKKIVRKAN